MKGMSEMFVPNHGQTIISASSTAGSGSWTRSNSARSHGIPWFQSPTRLTRLAKRMPTPKQTAYPSRMAGQRCVHHRRDELIGQAPVANRHHRSDHRRDGLLFAVAGEGDDLAPAHGDGAAGADDASTR